jgi:hypothetical protein
MMSAAIIIVPPPCLHRRNTCSTLELHLPYRRYLLILARSRRMQQGQFAVQHIRSDMQMAFRWLQDRQRILSSRPGFPLGWDSLSHSSRLYGQRRVVAKDFQNDSTPNWQSSTLMRTPTPRQRLTYSAKFWSHQLRWRSSISVP